MPGFKAENYNYETAIQEKTPLPGGGAKGTFDPGTVVRGSEKIKFKPVKTDWNANNSMLSLKANVTIDGKDLGEIEFDGKKEDSKVVLVPKDEKLKENLKAQLKCISDDDGCTEHYIDVAYKDKEVIYVTQVIPLGKKEDTEKNSIPPVVQVQPSKPDTPSVQAPSNNAETKADEDEKDENFEDFIDPILTAKSAYQSMSDEEFRAFMGLPGPSKKEKDAAPEKPPGPKTPAPPPGKPPVLPPPQPDPKSPKVPTTQPPANDEADSSVLQELEKFRTANQSVNFPQQMKEKIKLDNGAETTVNYIGRVRNATDFVAVSKIPGIGFLFPPGKTSIYGSFNLASVLAKMGEFMKEILPNKLLHVNSIGLFNGGPRPPGQSHQNGNDADIRYIRAKDDFAETRNIVEGNHVTNNFMVKEQWELIKKTFSTGEIEIIAVDSVVKRALCDQAIRIGDYKKGENDTPMARILKRIIETNGHNDHFHVRVRCGAKNPDCKTIQYKDYPVGC